MSSRTSPPIRRPRSIAAFCTAILAAAALALLPALPAAADTLDDLATAAAEARAAADAAHGAAAQAESDAASAASAAADLRSVSDADAAAAAAALEAANLAPDDPVLQQAATDAQAVADASDALADSAEALAAEAAAAAAAALAEAEALEAAAVAAEEALAAAQSPPQEEVIEPETEQVPSQRLIESCEEVNTDSFTQESFEWEWCFPEPEIDIKVENICPIEVTVYLEHLYWSEWFDYTVKINGVEHEVDPDYWGNASITVTDVEEGKFEVKVYRGDEKVAYDYKWIWQTCPEISTDLEHECKVIDGTAEVEVRVSDLEWWRSYDITVTGPDYEETFTAAWVTYWEEDLYLEPGEYTVTVESEGWRYIPDLGPVTYTFTVDPCPGEVIITITPVCSTNGSGSLGASLSGLVIGREYWVTVEGPDGLVTDVTFIADATTWAVPPAHLPPGTYTVTVVDTESYDIGDELLKSIVVEIPEYDPLTWTAKGTISPCPALASTGTGPSTQLVPALALLPLGAGLVIASALRRRRPLMESEEE